MVHMESEPGKGDFAPVTLQVLLIGCLEVSIGCYRFAPVTLQVRNKDKKRE